MSEKPIRIQRQRTKGWKMPPNTVYVGRPSKWGNPFTVGSIKSFRNDNPPHDVILIMPNTDEECAGAFRWLVEQPNRLPIIEALRGKNLACWCALNKPCHADVLLELANRKCEAVPDWEDLRGVAPDATGDMSSEDFVRKIRDEWPAP